MTFYRYHTVTYATMGIDGEYESSSIPNPALELLKFEMTKETPKGYWIGIEGFPNYKWIPKKSKKRFAYPTKEEALVNFIKRTESRIKILEYQIWDSKISLNIAKEQLNKLTNENN
jgi:hypothetical protein